LLEKLLETNNKREVLDWLYQSYMEVREYKQAKKVIVEVLDYSEIYLPNFYMLYVELTDKPKQALQVLNKTFETNKNTKQVGFYKDLISEAFQDEEVVVHQTQSADNEMQKLQGYLTQENWEEAQLYIELLLQDEKYVQPVWSQLRSIKKERQVFESLERVFVKGNLPNNSKRSLLSTILE